jgi:hypothetical protein
MGTEQPRAEPGRGTAASPWAPTTVAYVAAAAVTVVAFGLPVAVVTSFEGASTADSAVAPAPQWLVLVGLAAAAGGGRLRHAWPAAFTVAMLLVVGGGLLGGFGGELLIDMRDSDAGGHTSSGAAAVGLAAALALAAIVADCRAHLARLNPGRPHAGSWAAAVVVLPSAATIVVGAAAVTAGGTPVLFLVLLAIALGGVIGHQLLRRWTEPPSGTALSAR